MEEMKSVCFTRCDSCVVVVVVVVAVVVIVQLRDTSYTLCLFRLFGSVCHSCLYNGAKPLAFLRALGELALFCTLSSCHRTW